MSLQHILECLDTYGDIEKWENCNGMVATPGKFRELAAELRALTQGDVEGLAKVLYEARLNELAVQQCLTRKKSDTWENADDDERGQSIAQANAALAWFAGKGEREHDWYMDGMVLKDQDGEVCAVSPNPEARQRLESLLASRCQQSTTISEAELGEIEARCNAATPSWMFGTVGNCNLVAFDGDDAIGVGIIHRNENLVFAMHARTDIPKLIAALKGISGDRALVLKVCELQLDSAEQELDEMRCGQYAEEDLEREQKWVDDIRELANRLKGGV